MSFCARQQTCHCVDNAELTRRRYPSTTPATSRRFEQPDCSSPSTSNSSAREPGQTTPVGGVQGKACSERFYREAYTERFFQLFPVQLAPSGGCCTPNTLPERGNVLSFLELQHTFFTTFPANTGLFNATKRCCRIRDQAAIQTDHAKFQLF